MEVLVLFNYDAQAEDELTIRKGDVILDVKELAGGWWEGLLGTKRGLFPDNFVMVVTEAEMNKTSSIFRNEKGRKCRALFSYSPSHEDELELLVGDEIHFLGEVEEGWWRGKLGGRIGVFPSNFVITEESSSADTGSVKNTVISCHDVAPELPPKPLKEMARVLFPYSSLQPDELELREGDLVVIHSKECEDKGWWKGEINNKIGVFPDNFVELLPSSSSNGLTKHRKAEHNSAALNADKIPNGETLLDKLEHVDAPLSLSQTNQHNPLLSKNAPVVYVTESKAAHENPSNTSLSDEQKLLQVEVDTFHVIIPMTESLGNLTASRVRPTKRRPPSAFFIKDHESGGSLPSPVLNGVALAQETVSSAKPLTEENSRPTTKTRTSSLKAPWIEELKRNQEKKGSLAATSAHDKPLIPSLKPVISKSSPLSTLNVDSSARTGLHPPSSNDTLKTQVGSKSFSCKEPNLSPNRPDCPTQEPKYSMESQTRPVEMKRIASESSTLFNARNHQPNDVREQFSISKYANCELHSVSQIHNPQSASSESNEFASLSDTSNEKLRSPKSEDSVLFELRALNLRVASLETTVQKLQTQLLQMKSSAAFDEHKCQCLPKNEGKGSSMVHI